MKTKLLSIMLTLTVLITLFGIAAPASAAVKTTVPEIAKVQHDPLPGPYDTAYVSVTGSDATGTGTITNPWRTITHAVNMLPYDEIANGPEAYEAGLPAGWADDPPGSLAANNDRILVYKTAPNQWFGYSSTINPIAEHIVVTQPVLIQAYDPTDAYDANSYKVDITGQGDPQVIEIVASDVTIDGLFLTGADITVYAHPPLVPPTPYIENVEVLNCVVKVDQVSNTVGTGIEMEFVKYPDIINNHIYVGVEPEGDLLSVSEAWGIYLNTCFQSTVTDNMLDIHGDPLAVGIEMWYCPKSLVQTNTMNVLAAGDNIAIGIKAVYSDLIQILDNIIDRVETNGTSMALGFGIKVFNSNRVDVLNNTVVVQNNGVNDPCGLMLAMGIWLKNSNESNVKDNPVTVTGIGAFNGNVLPFELTDLLSEDDLADLDELTNLLEVSIGQAPTFAAGAAAVIGIKVCDSYLVKVKTNTVTVKLAVDFVAGDVEGAVALGGGVAVGILGFDADKIMVKENTVLVTKADAEDTAQPRPDAMVYIKVHSVEPLTQDFSGGLALAVSLGIALVDCDLGMVEDNDVAAYATEFADIQAVPTPGDIIVPLAEGSALARVNSELMQAVYQSFTETIESDEISAEVSGDLPSIESFAAGGGLVAGIGILVACSDGVVIDGNTPVVGSGDMEGNTWSKESGEGEAEAFMGGLGLGIGIAVIDSMSPQVTNNTAVEGNGSVDLDVGALHDPPVTITDAEAFGGGAGVGFGILLVGTMDFRADAGELTGQALEELEVAPEGGLWSGHTIVMGNQAMASGVADKIHISAEDQIPDHPAFAIGKGLGLAGGIVAVWSPCIVIKQNTVSANGNAEVCIISEAIDTFDPLSMGGAAGIGIGIASIGSWRSQIIDNEPMGQGTARGFVLSIETPTLQSPALGFGGSIGLGDGILVFGSGGSLVMSNGLDDEDTQDIENTSNAVTTGLGYAKTKVLAINTVPLDSAVALALAAGIGKGIAVVDSPCTDVVECNTAAGEGRAKVLSWSDADFDYSFKLGVSASIDILMKLWPGNNDIDEVTFEGRHGPHFGVVNYNSMVDADPIGDNGWKVIVVDAGLLKIGWPMLDAQFNWWNDPTGPTGFGPGTGTGEAVYWVGKSVDFTPWLYVVHTDVLYNQIGKFGFYIKLCKGLNTISTPIALEETVVPSRQWKDIVANSGLAGKIKYTFKWDDAGQGWIPVPSDSTMTFDPLDAWYIYLFDDCESLILMVNSDDGHPYSMPTRNLSAQWNLIGPNPLFPMGSMPADDALSSILQTPSGLPGYTQLISPVVRCQNAWYYVPGMKYAPDMQSGRGYWVWMENPDTLVGSGFSPLPDQLSKIYGGH